MVVLFTNPSTDALATLLMQVFITLVVCKILAKLLSYIRQPQVIGQIIAGILFGPSVLGIKRKVQFLFSLNCFIFKVVQRVGRMQFGQNQVLEHFN
jgi:Kef-type K+ transport system membrane component KefB